MPFHTTMAPYGITPQPTQETAEILEAAREGKLVVQRCQKCGTYHWPPSIWCANCKDPDAPMSFEAVSGRGSIYTWYICHDTSISGFEDKVPYAVILTELDEQPGLTIMSNLLNFEYGPLGEGIEAGMRVEVVFDRGGDMPVLQFQPLRP